MIESIMSFIMILMSLAPNARVMKDESFRKELSEHIVVAAHDYKIDPYFLTWNIYKESSFKVSIVSKSKRKEFGLCQVHGVAKRMCRTDFGLNIATAEGQVRCMAALLERGRLLCGNDKRGLYWYRSGKCYGKVNKVYNQRMRGYKKKLSRLSETPRQSVPKL